MQILLNLEIVSGFAAELKSAGSREIGGLLFGEHIGGDAFRVVEFTVQKRGGSHDSFVRNPEEHRESLHRFFERTGDDHSRFNYLGEWHSHPSFPPIPSTQDIETMHGIVNNSEVGANFLVLLILRRRGDAMGMSATVFRSGYVPEAVQVYTELRPESPPERRRIRRL
jgi:integrative and conjugative element protein (TIGR02256 family)